MLAQNFKTPADLSITDAEFTALATTLGVFERCEVAPEQFDMRDFEMESACGTTRCIGGWARHIGQNRNLFRGRRIPDQLDELFYPRVYRVGDEEIDGFTATIPQAAAALRNYLTHGEPRWAEAFA